MGRSLFHVEHPEPRRPYLRRPDGTTQVLAAASNLPCPCGASNRLCPDCHGTGLVTQDAIVDAGRRHFIARASQQARPGPHVGQG